MIVFRYRITGELGVRYLLMVGDTSAASLHDPHQHRNGIDEEHIVHQLVECVRAEMEDTLADGMDVDTEYERLAIRRQLAKPCEASIFDIGEFTSEERAEQVVRAYRNDPLKLHQDGCIERMFTV